MKQILEILAIILPALIILFGITRLFVRKTGVFNGLIMLFAILLLIVGLLQYYVFPDRPAAQPENKLQPLAVSKHSEVFNNSLQQVLFSYDTLTTAFSGNDVSTVNAAAANLQKALDSLKIEELKVDTIIYETALQPFGNAKAEAASIAADPSMEEKRASLNILSQELFSLLSTVRYDLARLYWLECSSAFGEDKPGNWISRTEQSPNPYGKPGCMEVKTSLNFVPADTTRQQ